MVNNIKLGNGTYYSTKNKISSNNYSIDNSTIKKKFNIKYVIPLYESIDQRVDIGIVYSDDFGFKGIVVKDGAINLLPENNIVSGFDNTDKGFQLIQKLRSRPPDSWELVYNEANQLIIVLPRLRAAGRLGAFNNATGHLRSNNKNNSLVEQAIDNMANHVDYKNKPNGQDVLGSFSGVITVQVLDKPLTVYRTVTIDTKDQNKFNGTIQRLLTSPGNYWSTTTPNTPTQYVLENAIHPRLIGQDIVPGTHVISAIIPAGSIIYTGIASSQGEILVKQVDEDGTIHLVRQKGAFCGGAQQIWITSEISNTVQVNQIQTLFDFVDGNPNNLVKPDRGSSGDRAGNAGSGGGSTSSFNNNLNNNGLTDSYNSTNSSNPMAKANAKGEIGGVAIYDPNAIMLDMHNSLYDLTAQGYWLTFPMDSAEPPFSDQELRQIIRELAQTIYIHNTFPFYSLHFTKKGTLYSVIHPAYQNTLVGKVISMLDYFMKGYLNGGYFNETDLNYFAKNKEVWINNYDALKPKIRSMDAAHKQAIPDGEYVSLSQLIQEYQIKQFGSVGRLFSKEEIRNIEQRFQISFRIIAKEKSIEKASDTLLFNGSFDVFYTIEAHQSAIGELNQYKESEEYKLLEHFCKFVAKDIKEKLPKLDICKTYFAMLDVICGVSYYFATLKKHELMPSFSPIEVRQEEKCLGMFPPYPKTQIEMEVQENTLWDFLQQLDAFSILQLDGYLSSKTNQISPELQTSLVEAIKRMLPTNAVKSGSGDLDELVLLLLNHALSSINAFRKQVSSGEIKKFLQDVSEAIRTAKGQIAALDKALDNLNREWDECILTLNERKDENIQEECGKINKQKLSALNALRQRIDEQRSEIDLVTIGYNECVRYGGISYDRNSEYRLKEAMRSDLDNRSNSARQNIKDEANRVTNKIIAEAESQWEKFKKDLNDKYKNKRSKINAKIKKIKSVKAKIRIEYNRLYSIEQNIFDNPTKTEVAKEVHLITPFLAKKPMTNAEDQHIVQISGGTGLKLNNQKLSNTALVRSLSNELSEQFSNHLPKLQSQYHKGHIENWRSVTFNNRHYQAFYVSHQQYNEISAEELGPIIEKPSMAKSKDEKRLLQLAAQKPNSAQIDEIKKLITSGVHLHKTDAYGNTVEHLAAMNDNVELLKLLLVYYKRPATPNQFGNYPVHIAAMYGHDAALEVLLKNNRNSVRSLTVNDESALYLAVLHHNLNTTKLLIDYGSDINEIGINGLPLIYMSLFNGSLEITEYLLGLSGILLDFQLENGNTLLHLAVELRQSGIVEKLIDELVELEVINRNGQSPLHIAAQLGCLDIVKLLLEADRSLLNKPNSLGYPPLYLAIKHGHTAICEYLLKAGANLNHVLNTGNALTLALRFRQVACARIVVQHMGYKFNLDQQVNLANFHHICQLGLWDLAKAVVDANPNALVMQLQENDGHWSTLSTCYMDYLCKANAYSQLDALLKAPLTMSIAFKYVRENIKKIYQIAIVSGSQEILRCLSKYRMGNPIRDDERVFGSGEVNNWVYQDYDLVQYACRRGITTIYKKYLDNPSSDIERVTIDNKNLAYLAAECGNRELLKNLVARNAPLYSPNGKHIFYPLVISGQHGIIRELVLKYNLDINVIIDKRRAMRAVDLACELGDIDTTVGLIACGAQIDEPNSKNKLAIQYAIESNALHVVRLIFKYELGGLEPMLHVAILHHRNGVFSEIIKNQPSYVSQILECSDKLLAASVKAGNLEAFTLLLRLGAKANHSLLHLAVKCNQAAMLKLLLGAGADVNAVDEDNNTAFHLACKDGNELIIFELLHHQKLNHKILNNKKQSPQDLANEWIKKVVLTNNMSAIAEGLVKAIREGSSRQFERMLLRNKVPVNGKIPYTLNGETSHRSLLEISIIEGKKDIVEYLLNQPDIKPNEINSLELTSVHLLMRLSDAQFIVSLIEKFNLDVNINNPANKITPLHFAVMVNNPALISYLISHGADLYAEEANNKTVMELAIERKSLELVKILIEGHNYDLHHRSSALESPLAIALKAGNLPIVQYLVRKGADISGIDGFRRRSALHYAVMSQDFETVHYVLTLGVDERITDNKDMLAAHLAAKQGNVDIVKLLSNFNPLLLQATDIRRRDANDFALIHHKTEVSSYISKRYGNIFKTQPTLDNIIGFKKYRLGGRTQLELAIIAGDQANIERLIVLVKSTDLDAIEGALSVAGASANPNVFVYVLNQLWDGKNHKAIRACMMSAIISNRTANLKEILNIIGSEILFENGQSGIELACKHDAQESLRCLLDYNQENFIETPGESIYLALKHAVDNSNIIQAKMLIESCDGGWEDIVDNNGRSLLHHAVAKNNAQILALFIMSGVYDRPNYDGITAKELAQRENKSECLRYLNFVLNDDLLASEDCIIKNTGLIKYMEDCDQTMDYEILRWLCSFQDINAVNTDGKTPLHIAIQKSNKMAVDILLSYGADTSIKDNDEASGMKYACNSDFGILKIVVQHSVQNPESLNTIARELCLNKNYNGLQELREVLASKNMLNRNDINSLFKDIQSGKSPIYTVCAHKDFMSNSNNILHLAMDMKEISLCDFIITNTTFFNNEFNIKLQLLDIDKSGNTVIHRAILLNNLDLLKKILIKLSKSEIETKNRNGVNPIVFAMSLNRRECFRLLISYGADIEKALRSNDQYYYLLDSWSGEKELDGSNIEQLLNSDCLYTFLENLMEFSQVSLQEKHTQVLLALSQQLTDINWVQYFMIATGKTEHKDTYDFFDLLAKYLPHQLNKIKASGWRLSDFTTLFGMAYADDNNDLFNYFLESGENPYRVLDGNLVVDNYSKVKNSYNLWYTDRLSELSEKLNSDLRFNTMDELAQLFFVLTQFKLRTQERGSFARKYHDEFWRDVFVLLTRGIDQIDNVPPLNFLENLKTSFSSIKFPGWQKQDYIDSIELIMDELVKNRFINDALINKNNLPQQCAIF